MDDTQLNDLVAELNKGATMMNAATTETEKMTGARIVSAAGATVVEAGGKDLLEKAYGLVSGDCQRTVNLEWYGLTGADGRQWL